ncbi:penicillin-binding protein 1C [Parvularcula sp. LCG005]|uniref:penicillin-binding protein 1C n=1 Tax=Parvularcula sp. LCG005 TaxID=3078805 RepID=UPI0029432094|nr:penicillin-binding protein 1C [Parvularcula sp. LCG005]WOI53106.1 penicillin-binding protein 1C [Parvularcula sp. LCG005]
MTNARRIGKRLRLAAGGAALTVAGVLLLDRLFPPPIERGHEVSTVVSDRYGNPLRAFPVANGRWRLAATLDDIDPAYIRALIEIEDQRFYQHHGVDGLALSRALRDWVRYGEIRSGASTITMQTARLLEPRPRTVPSKIVEMIRAVQLEARLDKDEILELYLTLTPYGGNIEGLRAASWAWFGREPRALSPDQIALLIALPQAPEARRPDRHPAAAKSARGRILNRLTDADMLAPDRAEDASDEDVPRSRHAFPNDAWHLAETVKARSIDRDLTTTIDLPLQRAAARRMARLAAEGGDGVQAAAIIIEIDTRAVRALIGSAGRDRAGGWIDLSQRKRSPGSTLKPFIYAMAFDDGLANAETRINDLPARFAHYRPENFDRTFRGEVTIAQALQHSLNVPAVQILDSIGANRFLSMLSYGGSLPTLPNSSEVDVGLAVALGGLGLTLQDLGALYAALGDEGEARPLRFLESDAAGTDAHRLVSAESAAEIISILQNAPAPPGRPPAALTAGSPRVAYKTGTSYGYRDAWAAGLANGYAIVVWTGRPDGAPRSGVTGRQAALPALFDLFDLTAQTGQPTRAPLTDRQPPVMHAPALARFAPTDTAPMILFPPDNAEVWADHPGKGFVLSARGEQPLTWYADGTEVTVDAGGAPLWTPPGEGFYRLAVVDASGRTTAAKIRVRTPQSIE